MMKSSGFVEIVIYKVVWNLLTSWFTEMKPEFRLNTFRSAIFLLLFLKGFIKCYLAEK